MALRNSSLDEGPVNTDVDDAGLGAVGGEFSQCLLGDLGLDAAKRHEDNIGRVVAVVLERLIHGSELVVEQPQELNHLAGGVEVRVEVGRLSRELGVQVGDARLTQSVSHTQGLSGHANSIVDVERGQDGGEQGGEQGHVLRFICGRAADQTEPRSSANLNAVS